MRKQEEHIGTGLDTWRGWMMEESEEYKKGSQMRPEGGLDLKELMEQRGLSLLESENAN